MKWCEDNLCAWITTPANTLSNLAFVAVAIWIQSRLARRKGGRKLLRLFPPAIVATGLTSFAFHASYTRFFHTWDQLGMYLFECLNISLNLRRASVLKNSDTTRHMFFALVILALLSIPIMEFLDLPVQLSMVILTLIQLAQELVLYLSRYRKHPQLSPKYANFRRGLLTLGVALACSIADGTRVWCDPATAHWINGHATWHVLSAVGMGFCFLFYDQMDLEAEGVGVPLGS